MKNKTLTLTEKNEQGEYTIFSGEERKRRLGYLGFCGDKFYTPKKTDSLPELSLDIRRGDKKIFAKLSINGEVYTNDNKTLFCTPIIFYKKFKHNYEITGKTIVNLYRAFELLNNSNKIPCKKSYFGGGLIGGTTSFLSFSEIYEKYFSHKMNQGKLNEPIEFKYNLWTALFAEPINFSETIETPIKVSYLKEISKQTKMPKRKVQKIDKLYPLDDNKEEIKESDLIKLILK